MKTKSIVILLLFITVFSYLIFTNKNQDVENKWDFEKVIGQILYFSNDKQLKVDLYDIKYIGQLRTESNQPLFVLSAKGCAECDENQAIYIYSPSFGIVKENGVPIRYSYPGMEYNYLDKKIVFESRMFHGKCTSQTGDSIVWFQKEYNPDGSYNESTFAIEVDGENIKETIIKDKILSINNITKNCKELPGIDFTTEP